jgi:hypothetical protein
LRRLMSWPLWLTMAVLFAAAAELFLHTNDYWIPVTDDYAVMSSVSGLDEFVATYKRLRIAEHVHAFALVRADALALNDSTGYLLVMPGDAECVARESGLTLAEARSITPAEVKRFATEKELIAALPTLPLEAGINWVQPRRQMDPNYWQAQKLVAGVAIVAVLTFSAVRLLTRRWRRRRVSASAADTA